MSDEIPEPTTGAPIIVGGDGSLIVPDEPIVCFIEGDGAGPELWAATRRVLDAAVARAYGPARRIVWREVLAGAKAHARLGSWLPPRALTQLQHHVLAIKGPLETPEGAGFRSLSVAIRQMLDLYAAVRPIRWLRGVPSPVRHPEAVDVILFQENTEGVHAGLEWPAGSDEVEALIAFLRDELGVVTLRFPQTTALGLKPVSEEGSHRLVAAAIQHALDHDLPSVTLVHQGDTMQHTEGAFASWGLALAEQRFGDRVFTALQHARIAGSQGLQAAERAQQQARDQRRVLIHSVPTDAMLQQILTRPGEHPVIAALSLSGGHLAGALAAQVGGPGIAPVANINYTNGVSVYEAGHGTVPRHAGSDKVNPSALSLSGAMMLRRMGWDEASDLVVHGIERAISDKQVTHDLHRWMEG
ncbi:MAG TPA: NADP-dependent isocitrate dehydrogenase, partial [Deltaproteobacteria bacterium]|nr:NADP-dependent isocitrate dehydrogenase [Deltaproteobacteria bacterium]